LLSSISVADDVPGWALLAALLGAMSSACKSVFAHAAYHDAYHDRTAHLGPLAFLFWVHLCLVPPYAFASILDGELILLTNLLTNLDGELILLTLNASTLNASTLSATTLSATTINASTTHAYIANASTANTTATAATTTAAASFLQLTATASLGGLRAMSQYLSMLLLVSHPLVSTPSLSSASVVTQALNIALSVTWQAVELDAMLVVGLLLVIATSALHALLTVERPSRLSWQPGCFGCRRSDGWRWRWDEDEYECRRRGGPVDMPVEGGISIASSFIHSGAAGDVVHD